MVNNFVRRQFIIIILLAAFCLTAAGCETLRKKFVRNKKEAAESTVEPILDPIDYPAKQYDPIEKYKYHYSMFQVWSKEISQNFTSSMNVYRQKYLCSQVIEQLQLMSEMLNAGKKEKLVGAISMLEKNSAKLDNPIAMANLNSVATDFERNFKIVRVDFKPKMVEKEIVGKPASLK
ncbi:MAG: hypothetical protein HQL25_00900 [Candidatus Omnitrophica bacterium]|nr:hypothetical protein [Candidatus Omnitrophota bacterium]